MPIIQIFNLFNQVKNKCYVALALSIGKTRVENVGKKCKEGPADTVLEIAEPEPNREGVSQFRTVSFQWFFAVPAQFYGLLAIFQGSDTVSVGKFSNQNRTSFKIDGFGRVNSHGYDFAVNRRNSKA